ncbi:hypothetical protein [Sphingomonas hengshuiensis]|uniref:Uncharacterized protein n=1 Tax=Sphingomonas hengshuiensis TaxID=1609977 RepID=A0A7U4LEG7_9SPHN|nr:hypothetical protein [Sphingomonas hengshuiensis]AJP71188.1 hypothetical protein TS85_04225 [Sphingomonas hengshuiensis]
MSDTGGDAPLLRIAERRFADDQRAALAARMGAPPIIDSKQLAAMPVLVTPDYLARLTRLNQLLDRALRAIVAQYFDDPRIRSVYALPDPIEAILRLAHGQPYRVGWHRPDFVHDSNGQPRVCEIGARYPLNGWMVSERAAEALAPHAAAAGLGDVTGHGFVDALCAPYSPGDTVAMLHAGEAGTEIFLLAEMLGERGIDFLSVSPTALERVGGTLRAGGRTIDHVILEMDRSELPSIPGAVLRHLIATGRYFNDVRTLILVHDKRVLAVLWDDAIRRSLLPADEAEELRGFLIPSWTIGCADGCKALLARDEDMIAKRSSGGRGIDALVRRECGEAAWRARVERDWSRDMYQQYLAQRNYGAPGDARATHLVGLQLCRDATSYGPGIFRGSSASVINLHGDRGLIYVPLVAR